MKISITSCFIFVLGLRVSAVEPLDYDNARSQPGEALGMAALAREIAVDAACVSRRVVATVTNLTKREAPDVQKHFWTNSLTKIEMVDYPSWVTFNLSATSLGRPFNPGPFSVIEWTTDFASNTNKSGQPVAYGHRFRNHREAVMPRPLTEHALICFEPPLQETDGSITKSIIVLPVGTLDSLAAANVWRTSHLELFKAKDKASDGVIEALRAELTNSNPVTRMVAMVQLMHLSKLEAHGANVVLKSCANTVEIAATTILILTEAPNLVGSITNAIVDTEANRQLIDGVAVGAATHFLNLPNSEKLVREAQSFQLVRATEPNPSEVLRATVSFPLLLTLADRAEPKGVQSKRETSYMLYKLLKASAALQK